MAERGFCVDCPSMLVKPPSSVWGMLEVKDGMEDVPAIRNRVMMEKALSGDKTVLDIYEANGVMPSVERIRNCEHPITPPILGLIGIRRCGAEL